MNKRLIWGLVAVLAYVVLAYAPIFPGLSVAGQRAIALTAAAIIAWVTEVLPITVTSILVLFLIPLLGIASPSDTLAKFAYPTPFYIAAAILFAEGMLISGLGRRIAARVIGFLGNRWDRVLLSVMLPTALLSTVILDIPTTIVFSSLALPLLIASKCEPGKSEFGKAVMIAIPVAAAIGGIGTLAGSGLNVQTRDLLWATVKYDINFLQWTIVGMPTAIILTFIAWFIITRMTKPEFEYVPGIEEFRKIRKELGPLSRSEKIYLITFIVVVALWFTQPWTRIDIVLVSVCGVIVLFLTGVLKPEHLKGRAYSILEIFILLSAINSLALAGLLAAGAIKWISNVSLSPAAGLGPLGIVFYSSTFAALLHYLAPVAGALVAIGVPTTATLAVEYGIKPSLACTPVGFMASNVFLLPLDPVPLVTYVYGYWKFKDMIKVGVPITIAWIVVQSLIIYSLQWFL
ncbi:MAG: anion transporter [Candidatus Verstraetearchaeota archaeon]|nr:anion transporter [Candidatus Verstraetearchaeota archaeon]